MTINISLIMTPYRSPHHDTLSFNRHSEWRQECFVRKQESGIVKQSEESMTPDDISHGFFRTPLSYSLSNLCMQKGLTSLQVLSLYQQLPILPGRFRPSTFGVCELNFRVRHGYG